MIDHAWLNELQMMVLRNPGLGVEADLQTMTEDELRGIYLTLRRREEEARGQAGVKD